MTSKQDHAERLARAFLERVWSPAKDHSAIPELMTEDYVIHSAGVSIRGRAAFHEWVQEFQARLLDATTEIHESFTNSEGDRIMVRWTCSGRSNGIFGLPADGRPVSFTGIAVWHVRDGRLAECWVERSALEALREAA